MEQLWCQTQGPVSSSTRSDLLHTLCWNSAHALNSAVLCAWTALFICHNMAGSCPKCPAAPFGAVTAILSPVTWIKTEDEGLNEKQITVDSVLPPMQELQEFRVSLLPSQKPGIYSPLQSYSCRDRHRWTDAQCSPHFISVPFRFTESTFPCLPWMHTQS